MDVLVTESGRQNRMDNCEFNSSCEEKIGVFSPVLVGSNNCISTQGIYPLFQEKSLFLMTVIIILSQVSLVFAGLLVAQQSVSRPPLLVAQMTEEWLNYYRKIAQVP